LRDVPVPTPREELIAGAREMAPTLLGTVPFGLVTGIASVGAGMSALQAIAMSVLAFSGIAQLITCQLLASNSPMPVIVLAGFVVSLRLMMYSAALAPHLAHLDRGWRALLSYLMTDQSFAATVRRFSEPGDRTHRHWHMLGGGMMLFVPWQVAVTVGAIAGAQVPADWSLDFAVVLTFIALLVPAVKTRADLAAAIVAAAVALVAAGLPFRLSLVVATVAGIAAAMVIERWHER
jgi:4-azaleucine resistance transporter AzlC